MIGFYFDEMMKRAVAQELVERGHTVIMATDVGMTRKDDDTEHLPYATELGLVRVTLGHPFAGRTTRRSDHAGLICWTPDFQNVGAIVRLSEFAETHTLEKSPDRYSG
jgi:hypothetical protein